MHEHLFKSELFLLKQDLTFGKSNKERNFSNSRSLPMSFEFKLITTSQEFRRKKCTCDFNNFQELKFPVSLKVWDRHPVTGVTHCIFNDFSPIKYSLFTIEI